MKVDCIRIIEYNVENMFDRAKAMNMDTWAEGRPALEAHAELNRLLRGATDTSFAVVSSPLPDDVRQRLETEMRTAVLGAAAVHAMFLGDLEAATTLARDAVRDGMPSDCPAPMTVPTAQISALLADGDEHSREELRGLMNGELGTAAGRGDLVRLALRLIVEEALEGEVNDALGRERYERGEDGKAGYRNGYRPGKIKTAEGAVDYSAPQVRDRPEPFVSNVRAALSGRTRELERLAVELDYVEGLG